MFDKILIANRGEIACRVARTARRMGIRTVAVYSDADAGALHVDACDEAYRLGPPPPRESYLVATRSSRSRESAGAQAIHPGYGFLSENEDVRRGLRARGLVFIGPPPAAIAAMGSKSAVEDDHGRAPACRWCPAITATTRTSAAAARGRAIGYPVLIKATAGGGGKGMSVVERADGFRRGARLGAARGESVASATIACCSRNI